MNHAIRLLLILLALPLALIACGDDFTEKEVAEGETFDIHYSFKKGDTVSYRLDAEGALNVEMTVDGKQKKIDASGKAEVEYGMQIKDVDGEGNLTVAGTLTRVFVKGTSDGEATEVKMEGDSVSIIKDGKEVTGTEQENALKNWRQKRDHPVAVRLDKRGKVLGLPSGALGPMGGMGQLPIDSSSFLKSLEQSYFPSKPVKIGESWEGPGFSLPTIMGGLKMASKFTLVAFGEYKTGEECLKVRLDGTLSGGNAQLPMNVDGALSGLLYISTKDGALIAGELEGEVTAKIEKDGNSFDMSISLDLSLERK